MKLPPVHPAATLLPLLSEQDLKSLAEDIKANGLLDPIVMLDGQILDGRNRWLACQMVGVEPKTVEWAGDDSNPFKWVWSKNVKRRHLTTSQRAMFAVDFEEEGEKWEAEQQKIYDRANEARSKIAKKRSRSADGRLSSEASRDAPLDDAPRSHLEKKSASLTAGTAKTSTSSVERARRIKKTNSKLAQAVRDGTIELGAAVRQIKQQTAADAVKDLPPPTSLAGPWGVIVADPPWHYDRRAEDNTHRAALPYPSMTLEEIRDLEIPKSTDDAILWLWTTNAHIEHAFGIARKWGFEPRTILTWVKDRMGTGDWLRGQTEHCLLCVKGHPAVTLTNQTTVIHGPLRAHSQKPDEFFQLVEALCPDKRRIELFAREAREGWAAWGEAGKNG